MWEIEYSEEVKFYFLDNYPYTFDILVRIEELRYIPNAVPPEGCVPLEDEPDTYQWVVLDHLIVYGKMDNKLIIWIIKPLE
ncbi:MAG: hypothetical protein U0350_25615 [Caldilineaceae bacterium]